ncbi:MAG: hypothetical protein ACT4QG_02215 [Sporichthyaceae bacterium]
MHRRFFCAAVVALAALAGCGGEKPDGRFVAGTEKYPLACLQHQADPPGGAYTAGEGADTAAVFQMLEYFTANKGVRAYCDGKPATDVDRQWARLYVDLGAEPANVAHILA